MSVERRGQVIRALITLVNWQQEEPTDCGEGRQPLMDGTSRVSREAQARFCEGLGVQLPGATRPVTKDPCHIEALRGVAVKVVRLLTISYLNAFKIVLDRCHTDASFCI